ncbi:radical SAM protein [Acidipila rosea]|uniref:Elp3/MiaA/NifB-like radical SAM core domain-containing protein n=1 Tax=Acidipila rosea TaxID=768535 RepID=A0A4R1L700_9BACT|nr:radical SAM protein [Acidipila rosea]TCK72823.1 hypothetical protein C7378_2415 [Acidipila rosea]
MTDLLLHIYPEQGLARDRWIVSRRPAREQLNPGLPYACFVEDEATAVGTIEPTATIFLTNRECPFRCVMCDLWRYTLTQSVPPGAIPAQIDHALATLAPATQVKLYNSGNFFDPGAIPPVDYPAIAERLTRFERVIVENHPLLTGESCLRFRDLLSGRLEIAMGLETAHPETLARLNKRMTPTQFATAAHFLRKHEIDLRVFILVQPPFMPPQESLHWAQASLDLAFDLGATAASLIPTRGGNGAMETLAADGSFVPPSLVTVEAAMEYGLRLGRGRVFVDTWDLHTTCAACNANRVARLRQMNLQQTILSRVGCAQCGAAS